MGAPDPPGGGEGAPSAPSPPPPPPTNPAYGHCQSTQCLVPAKQNSGASEDVQHHPRLSYQPAETYVRTDGEPTCTLLYSGAVACASQRATKEETLLVWPKIGPRPLHWPGHVAHVYRRTDPTANDLSDSAAVGAALVTQRCLRPPLLPYILPPPEQFLDLIMPPTCSEPGNVAAIANGPVAVTRQAGSCVGGAARGARPERAPPSADPLLRACELFPTLTGKTLSLNM